MCRKVVGIMHSISVLLSQAIYNGGDEWEIETKIFQLMAVQQGGEVKD